MTWLWKKKKISCKWRKLMVVNILTYARSFHNSGVCVGWQLLRPPVASWLKIKSRVSLSHTTLLTFPPPVFLPSSPVSSCHSPIFLLSLFSWSSYSSFSRFHRSIIFLLFFFLLLLLQPVHLYLSSSSSLSSSSAFSFALNSSYFHADFLFF